MRGSVLERGTCPVRVDDQGRQLTCGKQHRSWSHKVDVPALDGARRQTTKLTVGGHLDLGLLAVKPPLEVAASTNYRTGVDRPVVCGRSPASIEATMGWMGVRPFTLN